MSARIPLLLVSPSLSDGGAERFTSTLLRHLDRERFAPSLCLLHDRVRYPVPADVPVHVLDHPGLPGAPRTVRRLRAHVVATRPRVVLSAVAYANVFTAAALRGLEPLPAWVARVGNDPARTRGLRSRGMRRVLRRAYRRADRIVANSRGLARALAEELPPAAGRIVVLRNPVELPKAAPERRRPPPGAAAERPVVLTLGRLERQKRPDLLLAAFERVARERPAELWIAGEGALRRRLGAAIRARGLADRVKLLGFRPDPTPLLRRASVFVLASEHEGLPHALIEAQGAGLPAVATRCRFGPDEIVEEGRTGRLVEPGDAEGLAAALAELLDHPARAAELGRAGAQLARERFDAPRVLRDWEKLLAEAAEAGPRGAAR